jgi:hypothetical protein
MYCKTSDRRFAPTAFLIPTSFIRRDAFAVEEVHKVDACHDKNEQSDQRKHNNIFNASP